MKKLLQVLLGVVVIFLATKLIFTMLSFFGKIIVFLIVVVIFLFIILAIKNKKNLSGDHEKN